jgi:hypothetical protein
MSRTAADGRQAQYRITDLVQCAGWTFLCPGAGGSPDGV